jgi:predicted  nucleic acid-binding Zn-ribbon protein
MERIPKEIEDHYSLCQMARDDLEQCKNEIKTCQVTRKNKELEVEAQTERMKKELGKQHAVKTNREYTALLDEIENIKRFISTLEDEQIELMELVDQKNRELGSKEENLKTEEKKFAEFKAEKEENLAKVKAEREQKEAERKRVIAEMDSGLLRNYNKVYELRGQVAVARYLNGICQGCNFKLPPQLGVEIKQNEKVISCPFCNRFLFYENSVPEKEPG